MDPASSHSPRLVARDVDTEETHSGRGAGGVGSIMIHSDDDAGTAGAARRASKHPFHRGRPSHRGDVLDKNNNKNTIASSAEDLAYYAPPPQPLLRSSPSVEDFSILGFVGAGHNDDDDDDDDRESWRADGRGTSRTQHTRSQEPFRQKPHLPPPSPPRRPKGATGRALSRRKHPPSAAPFWPINRMRSNSTDSVRGAFYQHQSDVPSYRRPPKLDSRRTDEELPPPSSSLASGAGGKRPRALPKRRRRQSNKALPPGPPGPSSSSSLRMFSRRDHRASDRGGAGSSTSEPDDDIDDDFHYRSMAAAELGRAGLSHEDARRNRRSFSRKPPRDDNLPSKIVRYGTAAANTPRHDENQRNAPNFGPPTSYQWTISPAHPDIPTILAAPASSSSASSRVPSPRRTIGEGSVPPVAHRSFAPRGAGSEGSSGLDGTSSSQDDAWSSESDANRYHVDGKQPHQSPLLEGHAAVTAASGNGLSDCLARWLDPTPWLTRDARYDLDSGAPFFEPRYCWTAAGCARHLLWNPIQPEFTSLQLFSWAVVMGVFMGFFTAAWKALIESCIHFLWVTVPVRMIQYGIFTPLDGIFPLYHFMWICPAVLGGVLTSAVAALPDKIPDQNDWIRNVHTRGTQDHKAFLSLFVVSTAGMASGLSLGPELPLVLAAGMAGSWLGVACKQSVLQARVMNLTAASAAVGGFFGFPMAGALFVLEIPHRMGLQYFEALSPATVSSIVAVLTNRLVVGNDVTGYFSYPFLTTTLPSEIFTSAIVYGFFGAAVGVAYTVGCKKLKNIAHDLFPASHAAAPPTSGSSRIGPASGEQKPLLKREVETRGKHHIPSSRDTGVWFRLCKAVRIASAGCLVGAIVGAIGMFIPHAMFWGEAQLQTLIDKGRTPLPVFGIPGEPTADLVALGRCMIDGSDAAAVRAGFGIQCSFIISFAKVITTGLSLGTGIVGGHFWGPLFVGCSSGHFLTDAVRLLAEKTGYFDSLSRYPCLVILCVMGSAHVVTYRAHMAIMLILTLTISAFDPEDGQTGSVAGDYSAVFPLLVVSVFVSLMLTRSTVFYPTQRSRGDIMAVPEVLCEPGMAGRPMVLDYEGTETAGDTDEYETDDDSKKEITILDALSPLDIEENFEKSFGSPAASPSVHANDSLLRVSSSRLDELLNKPLEFRTTSTQSQRPLNAQSHRPKIPPTHRRIRSDPVQVDHRTTKAPVTPVITVFDQASSSSVSQISDSRSARGSRARSQSGTVSSSPKTLVRIKAYGEVQDLQPSLLDQARLRAASSADDSHHKSQGFHSRNNSLSSVGTTGSVVRVPAQANAGIPRNSSRTQLHASFGPSLAVSDRSGSQAGSSGALTLDDIDRNFDARLASMLSGNPTGIGSRPP